MGGGGSGKDVVQTVHTEPWGAQQGKLIDLYRKAQALEEREFFPDKTYVPMTPESEQALQMQEERALAGNPLLPAAQAENLATMEGDYLDIANTDAFQKAFGAAYQDAEKQISPYIRGGAAMSGRYSGGLPQEQHTRQLGDAFAGEFGRLWAPLYSAERDRQQAATQVAPMLAQQDYADIGRLSEVGAAREAEGLKDIQDRMARWDFEQEEPWVNLSRESSIIQAGDWGGQTTSRQPTYGQSPLAGAIGGGLAGYGMFGPWGAAGGAALGGLSAK